MGIRRIYPLRHGETLYTGVRGAAGTRWYDLTDRGVDPLRGLAELWHTVASTTLLSVVLGKGEASGLLNVEQDFGCVNVLDHDGERFVLRLLNFTSYDLLESGLEVPAVVPLASGAQLGSRRTTRAESERLAPTRRDLKSSGACADTAPRDKFP